MKIKLLVGLLAAVFATSLMACSSNDDDINPNKVPDSVKTSFTQMFPNAQYVEWDKVPPYYVADFSYNTFSTEAWFNNDGEWQMTETDYNANVANLPALMQNAFLNSEYATWQVDDVEYYQRVSDTFCTIDIESPGMTDLTMFIDSFGNIIKVVPETEVDILPSTVVVI